MKGRIAAHAKNPSAIARTNNLDICPKPTQLEMWATVTKPKANSSGETASDRRSVPAEGFSASSFDNFNSPHQHTKPRNPFGGEGPRKDIAKWVIPSSSKRTGFSSSDVQAKVPAGVTTEKAKGDPSIHT